MNQNQLLIDNYLGLLHVTNNYNIITEQEIILEAISAELLVSTTKKKLQYIEKALIKAKVNTSYVKNQAKKMIPYLKRQHAAGKKPEQVSKEIIKSATKTIRPVIARVEKQWQNLDNAEKVVIGLAAFLVVLYVNTLIGGLAASIVTPMLAQTLTAVIVAPMVEEAAKSYFIDQGMPWIGTGIVFGFEAAMYIYGMVQSGMGIAKAVLIRAIALLFHFSTTYVQKSIIDKGDETGEDLAFAAWLIGVGMHSTWNTLATIVAYSGKL